MFQRTGTVNLENLFLDQLMNVANCLKKKDSLANEIKHLFIYLVFAVMAVSQTKQNYLFSIYNSVLNQLNASVALI